MKKIMLLIAVLLWAGQAWAVPTLQIGAPAGAGDVGDYADYVVNLTDPTENDTAVTSGDTLYVAGLYANKDVVSLGGRYVDSTLTGADWSDKIANLPDVFDGKGAILVATVPKAQYATGIIKIDLGEGNGLEESFSSSPDNSYFPNNHAPTNAPTSAYFFFDIGEFWDDDAIPDFKYETMGTKLGFIKELALSIVDFDWVHFDVMALQTKADVNGDIITEITSTSLENNPGSHDVTWKDDGDTDPFGDPVPEPGTFILVGAGLVGLALLRRKQNK